MRSILATRRICARVASAPVRTYATEPAKTNPTTQFYKTFTRPIAKVLLTATLTYQFLYWAWVKLETDEIRAETDATITDLEAKVEEYKKKVAEETKTNKA
jgi:hypothetical protein